MSEMHPSRLLIKMPAAMSDALRERPLSLAGNTLRMRELCPPHEPIRVPLGAAPPPAHRWHLAETTVPDSLTAAELWEQAHQALSAPGSSLAGAGVYIEPDLLHTWHYENPRRSGGLGAAPGGDCDYDKQNVDLPQGPGFAWHLGDNFSQLKRAREEVANSGQPWVRLGIIDVGFDFTHNAAPEKITLCKNFLNDQDPND